MSVEFNLKNFSRVLLLFSICASVLLSHDPVFGHDDYLDIASYNISAVYTPETHTITAQETVTYRNITPDDIPYIDLHLYLNAFQNTQTLWMRESGFGLRGYQYDPAYPGWMKIDKVKLADGQSLDVKALDADETLMRINLPGPIASGQSVTVDIAFTAVLPRVFARTGWEDEGDFVLAGQWFPKFGVWQQGSWNAYPFHANSEFYADFGTYDVELTLPEDWIIGTSATVDGEPLMNGDGTVTQSFHADRIIDFVWTASPHYRQTTRLHNGVSVSALYYPRQRSIALRSLDAALQAMDKFEEWYGPYGNGYYSHLTIVIVPPGAGGAGGMEYPTLFTVGALGSSHLKCLKLTEVETIHELAHQWFQSIIATNEAEEPWLDEGFTDYSTTRAVNTIYDGALSSCGNWNYTYLAMQRASYLLFPETTMAGKAWDFEMEYSIATYAKPVVSLSTLERLVGEESMLDFLHTYYETYAFSHPTANDLRQIMVETLGSETADWFFDELVTGNSTLDAYVADFESDYVILKRTGDLCFPTMVKLTSTAGILRKPVTEEIIWSCEDPTLRIDGSYTLVEIDPQQNLLVDLNLVNNSARRTPNFGNWLGVIVRVLNDLQNWYWGGLPW